MRPHAWLRRLGAAATLALAGLLVGAGGSEATELVVYSSRHYPNEAAFEAFQKKTGITLKILNASDAQLFERLKAEGDKSPADVLITVDAGNLWKAGQAGLLATVDSRELTANVPAHLRDPQNRWFGLTLRVRTIMYSTQRVQPSELSTYAALGDPKWKGRLCLRSSSHVYNQSLLAAMIKRQGEAKTEEMVKGWVANQPILIDGDTKVLEAVAAGQCDVAVTNHYYLARLLMKDPNFPVRPFWPDQQGAGVHVNISGAGVAAHSKQKADAQRFIEFLSTAEAQTMWAKQSQEFPVNPAVTPDALLAQWGAFKMDDLNIAAAGEFQAAATRLADRAGYK